MRTLLIPLIFLSFPSFSQKGNSDELSATGIKRYDDYKSGRITYVISGDASGELSYEFNNWGWLESRKRAMEYDLFGMKSNDLRLEYRDGDYLYNVDLKTKKGKQQKDKTESGLRRYKSARETTDAIYSAKGGKITGIKKIMGNEANIWTFETGNTIELWEWKGMILGGKMKLSKINYEYIAVKIDLDVETNIQLPDGISWEG